jgi:NADPH:quinone reductase-like Zn-dependent oxidoreductase
MRAIVQKEYGTTADVLQIAEIEQPAIGADEVLVKVRAAGLDRGTWHLMAGMPYAARLAIGLRAPKNPVPGLDVPGVVAAVGSDITRFQQPGDEVFGVSKGSFAEFAAARGSKLARKPSNLSFEPAAAVPVSGMTALQGLSDVGHLQAGQKVLIVGASGGVGSYAVQIAKALGAEVTGVGSTSKLELVRSQSALRPFLERLTELIEDGKLVPAIEHTYQLSEMPNAMRHLQAGSARGKLVIAVSST